jgi:putative transposase
MANTFTQLHIQFVFAVQNRISLIQPVWEEELFKYITGIVKNHKHKMITINGMPDHIHIFLGLHPMQSISNLMQIVKGESSEWINKRGFVKGKFQWQEGYGAFSYGHSQVNKVYNYVMKQKEHHKKRTFLDEYRELLEKFEVPFEERYIFKAPAD